MKNVTPQQPLTQRSLGGLTPVDARQLFVTVEHATNQIPARYKNLGLSAKQVDSHIAWDPGAKTAALIFARMLGCPCHRGGHSRLLIDLNRSPHHPRFIARQSFGVEIPGNQDLSLEERNQRIERYYAPYRARALAEIQKIIRRRGRCVHLSFHSFTPRVGRVTRDADVGLLYDPRRPREKALAKRFAQRLREQGYRVRNNYPYRGISDGHVTHLRTLFPDGKYLGLEIEINQNLVGEIRHLRAIARAVAKACDAGRSS